MELLNVLSFPDGVYLLVKCKCGVVIKHRKTTFRITCPECNRSLAVSSLKESKPAKR